MNASIDKAYLVDRQAIGEVLRVRECVNTPGGKGLNVARASSLLGGFAGNISPGRSGAVLCCDEGLFRRPPFTL